MELLRLVAFDAEDVAVLSAHLQDAVLCVDGRSDSGVIWRPAEKRLVLALNRFDWESVQGASASDAPPPFRRRRSALRFERVMSFKSRGVAVNDEGVVLNLLALTFEETDAPAGLVTLTFSGGAALRLQVECLEAELADLGEVWTTNCCPDHAEAPQPA